MGNKTMSRRERVLAALQHREPDRVPMHMTITVDVFCGGEESFNVSSSS